MKKALCILLALLFVMSICVTAFAEDVQTVNETASVETVTEGSVVYAKNTAQSEPDKIDPNAQVAILYLCTSAPHGSYIWGHSWVCIRNTTDRFLTIGTQTIAPGEMISAGLHHDGGMHFNDEMRQYANCSVKAISTTLTTSQFEKVSEEILAKRWSWYEYLAHNCTNFASAVWKAATGKGYFCFCFPFVISLQMTGSSRITIK